LYNYVRHIGEAGDKKVYLSRDRNGRVQYPRSKNGRTWYQFQIDAGTAAMFSPVPAARADRLRSEVVILKTFWDMSSSLRARRLKEIIRDNWAVPAINAPDL
jgi:hypothetical protein